MHIQSNQFGLVPENDRFVTPYADIWDCQGLNLAAVEQTIVLSRLPWSLRNAIAAADFRYAIYMQSGVRFWGR